MKAVIVAFDQFTDIDIFLAWDLLNRITIKDDSFEVKIIGSKTIHSSVRGIELRTQGRLEESNTAELVFFASGVGSRALLKDRAWLGHFQLDPEKQLICSICSGALLLAALGLLDGLSATTYPTASQTLRGFGVEVVENQHLVTHGNIATAAGCLAAVDLIDWAITRLYDQSMANSIVASVLPVGKGQSCIY